MIASEIDVWIAIIDKALKAHDIAEAEAKFCYEAAVEVERRELEKRHMSSWTAAEMARYNQITGQGEIALSPNLDTWLQWRGGCERTEYDS